MPVKSSMLIGRGPLLITRSIRVPGFRLVPGAWETVATMPWGTVSDHFSPISPTTSLASVMARVACSWSIPTRLGMAYRSGPRETTTSTVACFSTLAPPAGSVLITIPFGTVSEYCCTTRVDRPFALAICWASACFALVSVGIAA